LLPIQKIHFTHLQQYDENHCFYVARIGRHSEKAGGNMNYLDLRNLCKKLIKLMGKVTWNMRCQKLSVVLTILAVVGCLFGEYVV